MSDGDPRSVPPGAAACALVERGVLAIEAGDMRPAPWWSLTKTAIAAAALVLVEHGELALDAPLDPAPYTLRHLLQHSAGLPDYGGLVSYRDAVERGDAPWTDDDLLAAVRAGEPVSRPGERFAYSNVGYLFVRRLIERATRLALQDALNDLVFAPLGLHGITIAVTPRDLQHTAWGNVARYHPGWVYHGLAVGTASQAALFVYRLMTGELLNPATRGAMRARFPVQDLPLSGRPWRKPGYGLGLMVDLDTSLRACYGHTGGGPGSTAAMYYFPDLDPPRAAAVLAPHEDAGATEHATFDLARGRVQPAM